MSLINWNDPDTRKQFGHRIVRAPHTLAPPHLAPDTAAALFAEAWVRSNGPDKKKHRAAWVRWARLVGYIDRGQPAERPTEPLTLFRAAPASHRLGMSWASTYGEAFAYVKRHGRAAPVWTATIPPRALLARLDDPYSYVAVRHNLMPRTLGMNGDGIEYVVDPLGLTNIRTATATQILAGTGHHA